MEVKFDLVDGVNYDLFILFFMMKSRKVLAESPREPFS